MSGFDPAWLALREPADHAARNPDVLAACASHFAGRDRICVVDLGCGAGSNLRALAPHLPQRQEWRLVDRDPTLLDAARQTLRAWAEAVEELPEDGLRLSAGSKRIDVHPVAADLARGCGDLIAGPVDLVAAAALFDLASEQWMRALCDVLASVRTPLYASLIYNGVERWSPPDARDVVMLAAFHAHQTRDKGFGPAAGPAAARLLAVVLDERGYAFREGPSNWSLSDRDRPLIERLAEGTARACDETGLVDPGVAKQWSAARSTATASIGHTDLFAWPRD